MNTDLHDTRLALREALDLIEWLLVRDKKRLGDQDVKKMLRRIDLARVMIDGDDEE